MEYAPGGGACLYSLQGGSGDMGACLYSLQGTEYCLLHLPLHIRYTLSSTTHHELAPYVRSDVDFIHHVLLDFRFCACVRASRAFGLSRKASTLKRALKSEHIREPKFSSEIPVSSAPCAPPIWCLPLFPPIIGNIPPKVPALFHYNVFQDTRVGCK